MRSVLLTRSLRGLLLPLLAGSAFLVAATPAGAAGVQAGSFVETSVDLGDVPLESAVSKTVTLRSTGTAPLQFSGVLPGPGGYETLLFAKDQYAPLAPGASRTFTLAADPMTLGPVDTTLSLQFGDATTSGAATIRVKYRAVPQPVLPYAHFDLRLNDDGWNDFLFSNASLRPIGGATGTLPGKYVFRINAGKVSATNTGVLSSYGGLELKRWSVIGWNKLGVDLTRGHLTAVVGKGPRVDVADLSYIGDNYDLEGHLVTYATVVLNKQGAADYNAIGVRPAVAAGRFIGTIEILKG